MSSLVRNTLVLSSLVLAALGVVPPAHAEGEAPAAPAPDAAQLRRDRLAGRWKWVGGAKEIAARDAAVDKGIESLFFAIRGMARSRIKPSVEIRQVLGFAFRGGNVVVSASGKADVSSPEDGRVITVKGEDGNPVKLSHAFAADGHLEQTFRAEEGGRSASFKLTPDGKTLHATYTIFSPKLSNPIVYTLSYQRE